MSEKSRPRSALDELLLRKADLMKILNAVRADPEAMAKVQARVEENRRKAALVN